MENALTGLTQIQGVKGYSVFDAGGSCVAHQMPPPYEPILLNQVFIELRSAFDAVRFFDDGGDVDSFVGRFDNGCVVLRPVAGHSVLLLTAPDINMAMLNVGFKVAAMKLERVPAPFSTAPAVKVESVSLRADLSASPVSQTAIPIDAVGMSVMSSLVSLLATHIGPMAKVVLKKQLGEIGLHPQTVGRSQYEDVIGLLARKIPDPKARNSFVAGARALLGRS